MKDAFKTIAKFTGGPIVGLIIDAVESSSNSMNDASKAGIESLKEEAEKQSIKMDFSQHQARVQQELAIAKRIANAEEVEIEEQYEGFGKGTAGLSVNAETNSGTFGFSEEKRRVSKRIYRFKGFSEASTDASDVTDGS